MAGHDIIKYPIGDPDSHSGKEVCFLQILVFGTLGRQHVHALKSEGTVCQGAKEAKPRIVEQVLFTTPQ